jgi:hypothetical protein
MVYEPDGPADCILIPLPRRLCLKTLSAFNDMLDLEELDVLCIHILPTPLDQVSIIHYKSRFLIRMR